MWQLDLSVFAVTVLSPSNYYLAPTPSEKYFDQRVGMSVCMSVCLLAYLKTTRPNLSNFLYMLPTVDVVWSASDDNAVCYVLPVLWMTSWFLIMERNKDDPYVLSSSPGGGTRGEVCRLWLQLVMLFNTKMACKINDCIFVNCTSHSPGHYWSTNNRS